MRLLSAIVRQIARSSARLRTPIGAFACAAAFACAPTTALTDELRPEQAAVAVVQAPLDQTIPLKVVGDVGKVVVSQPETVQVHASGPNGLFVIGRERGTTNILVYDRAGRFSQSVDVQVGYDARGLRETLAAALPDERIEVTSLASGLVLDGEVSTAGAADVAVHIAERAAPDAVFSRLRVRDEQVSVDVRILEVNARRLMDIGSELGVSDGLHVNVRAGSGLIGAEPPEGMATLHLQPGRYRVDAKLQALESKGQLEVVAQPTLTALSGETARFRAGGEFPYPVPNGDSGTTLEFKQYGTALGLRPEILSNGLIRLNLSAELSELDPTVGLRVGGFVVPGLLVRRAATSLDLHDGESYLIAGLFNEAHSDAARGVPILSDLPVLGPLMRAVQGIDERRELAVVVTPRIVRAGLSGAADGRGLSDIRTPTAVSAPRGPPRNTVMQQMRRIVSPPVRLAKRLVTAATALFHARG